MLPSKKILIALAILVVGLGALGWYVYNSSSNTNYTNSGSNVLSIATSSDTSALSQTDSNHNGIPDWQEALYKVSPNSANTGGAETTVIAPDTTSAPEKLTLTDQFARDFFQKYASLQQSGTKITSDNADQVASDYLKTANLPTINSKQYTQSDLNLTNSSKADFKNYQDAITAVFNKYWPAGKTSELSILQDAFTNDNASALNQLAPLISAYQSLLQGSLTTPTPKLAVSLHLGVINSLSTYIQTLKMIQAAYTDPVGGLVGLNAYQTNQTNLLISLGNLKDFLINSLK